MVNLLGVKGSNTKRFFAEATSDIPKGMTADQYNSRMLQEIEDALPKLKQTVARFPDLTAEEKVVYEAMIKRLSDARRQTYGDLHGIHSSIKIAPEKTMTPAAIAKMVAADELKRRQAGHSVGLSDNAFKTPENGFVLGGFLGAITKGKAMHRIGAGFGKDSTGGWGVTSLEIGMAEKLFASTGLTKRTQRLFYDKFAAELAKEMPYGYAKNAQGQLLKALEPDIMDSVIRSSAGSVLSDPSGRKVLSAIDREILRKKFANWESKKDTPLTESLKKLIFNMEGREKGGPVNSGQPYIVGEKGPEIFVPRNAGGIIPNKAPMAQGYVQGGFIKMMLMQMLGAYGGQSLGKMSGIPGGDMIGMMLGSMLGMGGMGGGAKTDITSKGKLTRPMGQTVAAMGPLAPGQKEVRALSAGGVKMEAYAASTNKLKNMAAFAAKSLTRLNLAVGLVSVAVGVGINRYKAHQESMRLNALGYGMTAESAQKAGLKFTNFNDKIKEAIGHAEALRERNKLLYESMNGSGTPLNITIEQYKKLKKEVKDNYQDQVLLINKTSADDQGALAVRLKEQLIAMGVSADEAAKKIYAMYAASKFAASAAKYTVSNDDFNAVKDSASAAVSAIKSLNAAMAQGKDPTEQANQLNTAMMALSTDVETRTAALIKKRRAEATKNGEYFSGGQEKQAAYDAELAAVTEINNQVKNQVVLTSEVVDELALIDPAIRKIVNEQETGLSLWQKTRIQLKGFTGDLRGLSAAQANDLYNLQIVLGKAIATANANGALKKQYKQLEDNKKLQAKYERDARGQKVKDQISDRDKMASLQKQIDLNNKLADARIKALTAAKEEGDIGREIAKKQAEYDAALATGDTAGAQQASLDMEGLQGQLQYNSQVKSIEESTARLNAPLIKQLEALQKKQQDLADKAAIAGEKLGDLTKVIGDQETAIDAVNSAMLDYELRLLSMAPAQREEWKKTKTAREMIDAIGDAAKKAGVKLDGIKADDIGKKLADGIQNSLKTITTVNANGNVTIQVGTAKFEIGKFGAGTKEDPLNAGTAQSAYNTVDQNRSWKEDRLQNAAVMAGTAPGDVESINEYNWNAWTGPYSLRQIIKDYAEMMSYTEGTFFKLQNKDGSFTNFKVVDAKGNVIMVDGKAMGGSVKRYDKGSPGGVRGPGTKTSDSIPALLSDGEWVIKADSVEKAKKQFGPSFFDDLNAGRFHTGGPVHKHRSDGSHEVSMSAMTPQKQAASNKAMDKLYEKNPDYYKNKNGEWTKKGPSQWEKYTTASNWLGLFQNGGGTGAISDDIQSKLLTMMFGPNASKMNSTGKDFKTGEWVTGGLNVLTAGLTGTVSTAFGRALIEQLGISKGIPGLGALLPKGSFPFLGAAGSKLATNAGTAAVIGGARPFVESKLAPTIQKPKVKVTAEQFKPNTVYPPYVLHEGMSVPLHSGGPFGNDAVVFQGINENLSSLLTNHQVSAVIPTTPEGILSYILKKDPANKKAQVLLDKINSGYQWGDKDVKEFLMNMLASGNVNLKNIDPQAITNSSSSEGLVQLISAMRGNAKDSIAIQSKTKAMSPILSRMAEEYAETARIDAAKIAAAAERSGRGVRGGFFGNYGEEPLTRAEIAAYRARGMEPHYIPTTPDDIPMIRVFNEEFPKTDGQGDLFETAAGFKIFDRFVGPKGSVAGTDDAASHAIARTSRHFGIYDAVQSHFQGAWKPDKPFIVSTLSNLMKYNGKPEQLHSADSYFLQGFGKPFHYSKKEGQLSSVFPLEESAYIAKLKELGLHKDGGPLPVMTENPSTKEIL
jgi:hypothetical protein